MTVKTTDNNINRPLIIGSMADPKLLDFVEPVNNFIKKYVGQKWSQLTIEGHTVRVISEDLTFYINLESLKKVDIWEKKKNGLGKKLPIPISDKAAEDFHAAIKDLANHARIVNGLASDINKVENKSVSSSEPTRAEKVQKYTYPASDTIGVLRNALDLLKLLALLQVISSFFAEKSTPIFETIACLRIIQGFCSIALGAIGLSQARANYYKAKEAHDVQGMAIYKRQMIDNAIVILEGFLWIAIGLTSFVLPIVGVGIDPATVMKLQWVLFYGGFSIDSLLTWMIANKTIADINKHYKLFKKSVLDNPNLKTDQEKNTATINYLKTVLFVTPEERAKIEEKIRKENLGLCTEEIKKLLNERILQKQIKKRMIAERMGFTLALLDAENVFEEVQKCFEAKLASQKATKCLAISCLLVNAAGIPMDLPFVSELFSNLVGVQNVFKDLIMSDDETNIMWAINDFYWVLINGLYLINEELCGSLITQFMKNPKKIKKLEAKEDPAQTVKEPITPRGSFEGGSQGETNTPRSALLSEIDQQLGASSPS